MALKPRTRLWIQDNTKNIIFGTGRVKILKAIEKTGSMNKAAQQLGMSYRTIWGKVHDTEERLGTKLIVTSVGSKAGGSKLTPESRKLIKKYEQWHDKTLEYADKLFLKLFNSAPKQKAKKKKTNK